MPLIFDVINNNQRPQWEIYFENAPDHVIEETGLSREELQNVLEVLYEHRIIN